MGNPAPLATQLDAAPVLATEPVTAPSAYSPGLAPARHAPTQPRPAPAPARWPAWLAPACTTLVTLAVTLWRIGVPSFWRDEGGTLSAVHRSFPQLIRMLGQMDAVHGLYYALIWPLVRLAGSGEFALRLPSALAMAAAAGLITALGRRLVGPAAGLAAGLSFAAVPAVSWFGQDARPFALETAIATAASYCFARLLEGDRPARWASWYTASLIALGLANIFGLLLIAAHGSTLLVLRGRAGHRVARRWLAAVTMAAAALLPLELLAWSQRGQVRWLRTPLAGSLASTGRLAGPPGVALTVAAIMAAALAVTAPAGWSRFRAAWPGRLAALGLPWLVVPPALLIAGSQLQPVYTFRYIVFCEPAVALLIGAGLAALGRVAGPIALALIVLAGLPAQLGERGPAGHSDNIRAMDQIIAQQARPGDAVLYPQGPGMTSFAAAYPYGLARLRNLTAGQSPAQAGTISGSNAPLRVVRSRLGRVGRVWVAEADAPLPGRPLVLRGEPFQLIHRWQVSDIWLWLYHREYRPDPD
ncbi:MAG TPA: glycosyltransferase family 39 protein [Streptosporangiaceae bacterium]